MTGRPSRLVLALFLLPQLALARHKAPPTYAIPIPGPPNFSPLAWLVGRWRGQITGPGQRGQLRWTVQYGAGRRVIVLRERLSLQAARTAPATQRSWLGILMEPRARPPYVLRVFTSTGFLIRYTVMAEGPEIRFNFSGGDPAPAGWLFRRSIQRTGEAAFVETVQVAPPGHPFFDYYKAQFTRLPSSRPATAPSSP